VKQANAILDQHMKDLFKVIGEERTLRCRSRSCRARGSPAGRPDAALGIPQSQATRPAALRWRAIYLAGR
jgi:hypothetical protein